ncbi:RNA polymerase II subunit Rpb5a [Giardia muris]|uniref:RNA polymerase II subunit Rpb5a n=1 Tax=Giardia muris TaxID=5742 RepID=A0A4Z1TBV9_GIAMU|nr:RNA polymerase II subunit Rpb5a [Giardia muris]|eukprot:TNJ30019.1 RNA polymerase II subunit Rpb5a [Giardia muris]
MISNQPLLSSFRARRVMVEMLLDRGYAVKHPKDGRTGQDLLLESIEAFQTSPDSKASMCFGWELRGDHQFRQSKLFPNTCEIISVQCVEQIKRDTLKDLERSLMIQSSQRQFDRLIYVIYGTETSAPTRPQRNIVAELERIRRAHETIVEYFLASEIQVNISRHVLVPKHVLLLETQKKLILEEYKCTEGQLPIIEQADPMARYLGMQPKDIVQIVRSSETTGVYTTFRICQ